jgi:hypothetical protein
VTARTINRIEVGGAISVSTKKRHGHVSEETWNKITDALARHDVELVSESDTTGSGARWMLPRAKRAARLAQAGGPPVDADKSCGGT